MGGARGSARPRTARWLSDLLLGAGDVVGDTAHPVRAARRGRWRRTTARRWRSWSTRCHASRWHAEPPDARYHPYGPCRSCSQRLDLRGVQGDLAARLPRPELAGDGPVAAVRASWPRSATAATPPCGRCTERFDGVALDDLRVPAGGAGRGPGRPTGAAAPRGAGGGPGGDPRLPPDPAAARRPLRARRRRGPGAAPAGRPGRAVRPRRPGPVPLDGADDGDPGPGGRRPRGRAVRAARPRTARSTPPTLAAAALAGVDEVYRIGGAQAIAAMAYGTETIRPVDVIVGPGNVYVSHRQAGGGPGRAGRRAVGLRRPVRGGRRRRRHDAGRLRRHRPDRAGRARPRRAGLAGHLVGGRRPTGSPRRSAGWSTQSPRRAEIEATLDRGGYAVLVDGPEQAMEVANAIAPEHLELMTADPEALVPLVRNAGAVFCGAVRAGQRRRLPRRPEPRAADLPLGPVRQRARRRRLLQAHPRDLARPAGAGPASRRTWPPSPRPRAWPPTPSRSGCGPRPDGHPRSPRTTSGLRPGYHSPQVDVEVRLNTNESPFPPPAAFVAALVGRGGGASPGTATPTGARGSCARRWPSCTASGPSRCSAPTAPTRCSRALCLAYGGPGPPGGAFEPTYALHTHIAHLTGTEVVEMRAAGRLHPRPRRGRRRCWPEPAPAITFLCSPNNPTGMVERPEHGARRCWRGAGPGRGRRGLRPVRRLVGAVAGRRRPAARRHPHLLQDLVDGGHAARLPGRAGGGGRGPRAGRPAVPPRRRQAGGRPAGRALRRRDGGSASALLVGRAPAPARRPGRPAGDGVAVAGQLHPVPAREHATAPRCGRGCSTARSWSATAAAGPASPAACGSRSARPRRTTASSPPSPRCSPDEHRPHP